MGLKNEANMVPKRNDVGKLRVNHLLIEGVCECDKRLCCIS